MSYERWLNYIKSAMKTSLTEGNSKKVFYKFLDGTEMIEEYNTDTDILMRRAWKRPKHLLCLSDPSKEKSPDFDLEIELGDIMLATTNETCLINEANMTPILTKRLTKRNIEWRIRNLPYPIETYNVEADSNKKSIIVRTTNRKFYKEIQVLELSRCESPLFQHDISVAHQHNTLIISYKKPDVLIEMERDTLKMLQDLEGQSLTDQYNALEL